MNIGPVIAPVAGLKVAPTSYGLSVAPLGLIGVVADVTAANVLGLCDGIDLVLDGTDNFETRFLVNEAALKLGLPWVYGGAIGASGQSLTILPGETPCLRCVIPEAPPPGTMPSSIAARVALIESSINCALRFCSTGVAPPARIMAVPPDSFARRSWNLSRSMFSGAASYWRMTCSRRAAIFF